MLTLEPKRLFSSFKIKDLIIKNRIVHSATFEIAAEDGGVSDAIREFYRRAAEGGSGLIITGMQAVTPTAGVGPIMVNTTYDRYEQDMKEIADTAHENGAAIFVQIQHAGYKSYIASDWKTGCDHYGPSDYIANQEYLYHAATIPELEQLKRDYAEAAKQVKSSGCDGVQIHAAHGFLLNSFLSPKYNHRTDQYGGPIENRARLLFEVYDAIRSAVGPDFPVSVKVPFSDLIEPCSTEEEMLWVCRQLAAKGVDMLEISSGYLMENSPSTFCQRQKKGIEGHFLRYAALVADAVAIPVVSVCGYRSRYFSERTLENTKIAAISMCRPLIREPDLPNRWKKEEYTAACLSCNRCLLAPQGAVACELLRKK